MPRAAAAAVAAIAAVLLALACLAPPAQAKGVEGAREAALAFLEAHAAGPLAANLAEAAAANGEDPGAWPSPQAPVLQAIDVPGPGASNISLLRPLRALALGGDPRAAPGGELTQRVLGHATAQGFGDPQALNDDAYAILALRAVGLPAGDERLAGARAHLLRSQGGDGGWGWAAGRASGTDMTGLAVEALHLTGGVPAASAEAAARFLDATRTSGGFAETPGGAPNCESTAWGLRASHRLGADPSGEAWGFLLGLQGRGGGFSHLPGAPADVLCTAEAATLLGEAQAGLVPGPPVPVERVPGVPLATLLAGLAAGAAARRRLR